MHMRKQVRLAKGSAQGLAESSNLNKPPYGLSSDHMPYCICANRSNTKCEQKHRFKAHLYVFILPKAHFLGKAHFSVFVLLAFGAFPAVHH